ncbi:MAG: hypothetical protein AB9903_34215 [Vulcanimicrobiota bacterium]
MAGKKVTSPKVAAKAGKLLQSSSSSKTVKTVSASALSQCEKKKGK